MEANTASAPELKPATLAEHAHKYHADAWRMYSNQELGEWVHLLTKRAAHRSDKAKAQKDLHDAQNYLNMLQQSLTEQIEKTNAA
jgi:hypothetical protein